MACLERQFNNIGGSQGGAKQAIAAVLRLPQPQRSPNPRRARCSLPESQASDSRDAEPGNSSRLPVTAALAGRFACVGRVAVRRDRAGIGWKAAHRRVSGFRFDRLDRAPNDLRHLS